MTRTPATVDAAKVVPRRLDVYRALCELSPEAYGPLARMIISTACADRECRATKRPGSHRFRTPRNIAKPTLNAALARAMQAIRQLQPPTEQG